MRPALRLVIVAALTVAGVWPAAPAFAARETVNFDGYSPGTIVVKTGERRLYYVMGGGKAVRYSVGVGRAGKSWTGSVFITGKFRNPDWSPPADVKRDNPRIPNVIRGGTPENPMGVAAMTLSGGGFVSYGCFRMYNEDITDLYDRVWIGTPVVVTR
jgi:lipoprotein-anchoring transpeptidase ErfK/SrfK